MPDDPVASELPRPEDFEKAKAANLANVFAKLRKGLTLTSEEKRTLAEAEQAATPPEKPEGKAAKKTGGILHTLQEYSVELGKDPDTIKRAMRRVDLAPKPHQPIPMKWIVKAMYGEKYVEECRAARLDNEERERKAAREKGEILEWEVALKYLNERLLNPLIQAFDAAPREVDREWIEKVIKPLIQQKLQPPAAGNGSK